MTWNWSGCSSSGNGTCGTDSSTENVTVSVSPNAGSDCSASSEKEIAVGAQAVTLSCPDSVTEESAFTCETTCNNSASNENNTKWEFTPEPTETCSTNA